ncbi:MAG: transporter permease [Paenibacillus sp.]|jgi:ABC-type glycerol-3-phosphate transport system permease component|nr:transporter permease [Paenibacillus sp.]
MNAIKAAEDRWFPIVNGTAMILFAAMTLYPLWREVSISLSHGDAAMKGGLFLWPEDFTFAAYKTLFSGNLIYTTFANSAFVAIVGTALNVMITAATAYPLTKSIVPGRKLIIFGILFTMLFSGGVIPTYLLIKSLGLINSLWSLILPGLVSAYNTLVMMSFFQSIPVELEESAEMDGANPIRTFISIIMPLSAPVLATIALWCAVGHWNEFFSALLYINERSQYTLPLLLRDLIMGQDYVRMTGEKVDTATETVIASTIVATILPILCVYPFLQKYFVKGVMIGSVKG